MTWTHHGSRPELFAKASDESVTIYRFMNSLAFLLLRLRCCSPRALRAAPFYQEELLHILNIAMY